MKPTIEGNSIKEYSQWVEARVCKELEAEKDKLDLTKRMELSFAQSLFKMSLNGKMLFVVLNTHRETSQQDLPTKCGNLRTGID